jgi:high-affinity iron transporter
VLATLVIGLREGLEAALIVGIIAAFLRRSGRSLVPMWIGVAVAVAASIGVGITLEIVEAALPQAAQEGMESVIGAVAVVFVTGMIVWMNRHARGMKNELETTAGEALNQGTAWALAGMAFLAVLKEGFETSVFLLATFQASSNTGLAVAGAVIGILLAIAIGVGIYYGGIRINLGRFFRITGVFLVLVAAGLAITTLRTAHEAGWLNAGQQRTVDLSWLAPSGSVQAALITGVLGIPADPRLIEVIAWFAYIVPVTLIVFWPAGHRLRGRAVPAVQWGIAGALGVTALVLVLAVPPVTTAHQGPAPIDAAAGSTGSIGTAAFTPASGSSDATLAVTVDGSATTQSLPASGATPTTYSGLSASQWTLPTTDAGTGPSTLSLDDLIAANGGRIPVGVSPQRNPGPFDARWSGTGTLTVWTAGDALLDAQQDDVTVVTISGGGLTTPRSVTVAAATGGAPSWRVAADYATAAVAAQNAASVARTERDFWAVQLPIALVIIALILAAFGLRGFLRLRRDRRTLPDGQPDPASDPITQQKQHQDRSTDYAAN